MFISICVKQSTIEQMTPVYTVTEQLESEAITCFLPGLLPCCYVGDELRLPQDKSIGRSYEQLNTDF